MSGGGPDAGPDAGAGAGAGAQAIDLADLQEALPIDGDAAGRIRAAAASALRGAGSPKTVSIALVDDARIHQLNRQFLQHDYPTDVIAFPLDDGMGDEPLLGEVVVSTETAMREAAERGRAPLDEVLLYVVHGVLHLLGYDDHEESDREEMRRKEAETLGACGEGSAAR